MYVSDVLKLTLRTGPSIENKIISVIDSGQMMEVTKPTTSNLNAWRPSIKI
jgi:uncharacterized protein YgiM (DUF1202 family)